MTPQALQRRLDQLQALDDADGPGHGVIVVPETVTAVLWALSVFVEQVEVDRSHSTLLQCEICHYPRLSQSECVACGLGRTPEPKRAITWPESGIVRVPWRWHESRFLKRVQQAWCSVRGVAGTCQQCRYPLATAQTRCLVCFDAALYKGPAGAFEQEPTVLNCPLCNNHLSGEE